MERANRQRNKKGNKARKAPKVPIKTWRWEEIRRSRRRGGYPWTHLYKRPFNEKVDPDQYTMDALRRSKSASTVGARSDGVEFSDVSSFAESGKTTPSFLQVEIVTGPSDEALNKRERTGSETIEEFVEDNEAKDLEDDVQIREFRSPSIASSGNISQYLEKEDRSPANSNTNEENGIEDDNKQEAREKRAKSEETAQRKRKLSAESGHSRYSLSKLGVMKKLRDAKSKLKVPKIAFPTKKVFKKKNSPPKEIKTEIKSKKEEKPNVESTNGRKKNVKPLYIYIPLKPPPGETDEFSHFEFESKDKNGTTELDPSQKSGEEKSGELDGKTVKEDEKLETDKENDSAIIVESKQGDKDDKEKSKSKTSSPFGSLERGPRVTRKPPLVINPAFKQLLKDVRQLKEREAVEEQKENQVAEQARADTNVTATPSKDANKAKETKLDDEEHLDLEEQQLSDSESPKEDVFDKLFEASTSKKDDPSTSAKPTPSDSSRNVRSKSAEPERKRRSSIESSYSRKSLSKLGIMKKLKEASEKIKKTFSLRSLKRSDSKKVESKEKTKKDDSKEEKMKKPKLSAQEKIAQLSKPKHVEPVYIHIPLKPPEGEKDEFSHLESESAGISTATVPKKEERTDSLDSASPLIKGNDIQFIFLTPPSDDEFLDEKDPDIPETPSSEDAPVLIGSLRKLAEHVVDEFSPETKKNLLETVKEESPSDKGSIAETESLGKKEMEQEESQSNKEEPATQKSPEDVSKTVETSRQEPEQMVVDVEDGLNEVSKPEELKSVLKPADCPSSPTLKKKVSFKRKAIVSKAKEDVDNGYEAIEVPKEEKTVNLLQQAATDVENKEEKIPPPKGERKKIFFVGDTNKSMSVDEEKGDVDRKIVKDTSLEDDFNKWSKAGDHEYEPVNPPEEVFLMTSSVLPGVTVIDANDEPKVIISATDILDKPLEEKKKPFFQFGRSNNKEKGQEVEKSQDHGGSNGERSRSSLGRESSDGSEKEKASEGPNKFQVALKHRTDQLKNKTSELRNKMRNIKKPNIHMPKTPQFKKPQFQKPDFNRFKIKKPKINLHLPKIPDTATIHFPNISIPGAKKTTEKRTVERRQYSTESTAGDSGSPKPKSKFDFDFSTFPRFKKKKSANKEEVAFGTAPRAKKNKEEDKRTNESTASSSIRIPLHSEDSLDTENRLAYERENEPVRSGYEDRETSVDIDRSSRMRFDQRDIAIDDEYERENQEINRAEYLNRWQHGNLRPMGEREREDDTEEELPSEEERIIGQLVEERFKRVGPGYNEEKQLAPNYERYEDHHNETLEERLRRDEDRPHYIDDEEEFERRQNTELITDLDNLEDDEGVRIRDGYSSEGSESLHRRGRLGKLDIDSDEFFVVHEIREGFQTPANALAQMNEYDPIGSNRSLPEAPMKKKPIKKPKRKKTPHVSQEKIPGDEESMEGVVMPSKPKRKSKKNKKKDNEDGVVPYQKTIHLEHEDSPRRQRLDFPRESLGILGDDERDDQEFEMYENEKMKGIEQPEIMVSHPYRDFQAMEQKMRAREEAGSKYTEPSPPPRRNRSMKSLSQSENESLLMDQPSDSINIEDYIIPAHQFQAPPPRPSRRSRSHTSSLSRASLPPSQRDTDSIMTDEAFLTENQPIPSYLIENQNYRKQHKDTQEMPPYLQEQTFQKPCAEEPCVQDLRDYMGYSIVDKSKQRDPPLPPPRTPPRRRKRQIEPEQKFATVPRNVGSSQAGTSPPIRPLRNYSTLGQVRGNLKESSPYENDKENRPSEIDIGQYIEMDDETNRDLISGEIVQKMRQRPLPAPPRPPRKTKTTRKSLQDITSKENIMPSSSYSVPQKDLKQHLVEEETVSTQTEPLPPDFVCEEIHQEPTDTIITPRISDTLDSTPSEPHLEKKYERAQNEPQIRRELITPSVFSYEETVTHGSLLVEPLDGAKVVPDHQLSRERLVPISRCSDDETSEIPESFKKLKSPEEVRMNQGRRLDSEKASVEVLKADKLQVADLDVDRLRVNELLASKIIVSEIDSSTISTNEIQGKSGPLKLGEIELPPSLIEEIVRKLEEARTTEAPSGEEKKTPIVEAPFETALTPLSAVDQISETHHHQEDYTHLEDHEYRRENADSSQHEFSPEPPAPPPRNYVLEDSPPDAPPRTLRRKSKDSIRATDQEIPEHQDQIVSPEKTEPPTKPQSPSRMEMLEPEVDDQPPPRPPEPLEGLYMPSQPPASFYELKAKQYVGLETENIPTAPRRKRRQVSRSRPVSRSRSTSDDSSLAQPPPQARSPRTSRRFSEPSIPELSGRLLQACGSRLNNSLKRLIYNVTENILRNADGKQDLHVMILILLVLIAGLILLGYGEDRTVVHLHHWEYFNPPKDL